MTNTPNTPDKMPDNGLLEIIRANRDSLHVPGGIETLAKRIAGYYSAIPSARTSAPEETAEERDHHENWHPQDYSGNNHPDNQQPTDSKEGEIPEEVLKREEVRMEKNAQTEQVKKYGPKRSPEGDGYYDGYCDGQLSEYHHQQTKIAQLDERLKETGGKRKSIPEEQEFALSIDNILKAEIWNLPKNDPAAEQRAFDRISKYISRDVWDILNAVYEGAAQWEARCKEAESRSVCRWVKASDRLPVNPFPKYRFKPFQIVYKHNDGQFGTMHIDTIRYEHACELLVKWDVAWLETFPTEQYNDQIAALQERVKLLGDHSEALLSSAKEWGEKYAEVFQDWQASAKEAHGTYLILKRLVDADAALAYLYNQGIMSGSAFIQAEHDLEMARKEAQLFVKEYPQPSKPTQP